MPRTSAKIRTTSRRGIKTTTTSQSKPAESEPYKEVSIGGANNGGTRLVPTSKAPRFYPAEDVLPPKKSKKSQPPPKLRASITPGTVLILLAGRFRGKRVVFVKQLESGLLLVTGPYKVNGVPLRRINQAYVIATSTKVDISAAKIDEKVNDSYFAKEASDEATSAEAEFFEEGKPKEKAAFPAEKASLQKEVDSAIIAEVKKTSNLAKYLRATFGLSRGEYPHQLKF